MPRSLLAVFLSAAFGAALLFTAAPATAHEAKVADFTIAHPWARASAGPARNSAAFMTIHNTGGADRLLAVAGEVAERTELHTHMMDGDIMRMRRVEAVEVPAGGTATLQPGGIHVMLIGLAAPLKAGDRFPLTLTFEKAGTVTVEVAVEAVGSMGPQGMQDGMDHGEMNHGNMPGAN